MPMPDRNTIMPTPMCRSNAVHIRKETLCVNPHHERQKTIPVACFAGHRLALVLRLAPQGEDVRFIHISRNEGLSQNSVYSILQDRDGFMWFGTENGLNRFDGNDFTVFRHVPGDPASMSHGCHPDAATKTGRASSGSGR